ncbi:MAG: hypothetical protein ACT4QE_19505 [Anaerolineales bacterium]
MTVTLSRMQHHRLDLSQIQVLTFDCYGTLIDWETGLLIALQPVFTAHGVSRSASGGSAGRGYLNQKASKAT